MSVQPGIFVYAKNTQKLSRIPSRPRVVYLNDALTGHCLASVEKGVLTLSWLGASNSDGGGWVCAREYVCACMMCLQYTIIIFDPG